MKKAVILHGTLGSPKSNWFEWLQKDLLDKGFEVWLPTLPGAEQPSLREWQTFVTKNCPFKLDDQTIIIGHSSGAILAVILAAELSLGAIVCLSVFQDNSLNWEPNNRLFDVDFNFEKVKQNVPLRLCIQSDDDPYVSVAQAKFVADGIAAEFLVIPGQGHFNLEKSDSYKEFPRLVEELAIRNIL